MPKTDQDKTKILSKNLFPVVGIGASAGGLDAFKKLVKAIPEKSGMAYILVQHLHPDHISSLPEILQRETNIPVHEISDNVQVRPDQVYVIPSNKMLVANDGVLQLSPRPSKDKRNMPIDIFFSSLAEVHQSHAIGIVLSGNGVDGTLGLKNIKVHGGVTFAQDLDSAIYDTMPQSAIDADAVDFILAPEKMPEQLLQLNQTLNIAPSAATAKQLSPDENYKKIFTVLRQHTGVDFTYYKQTTIQRRILRRMVILKLEQISDYRNYLERTKTEQEILFQDLLIPVTSFFRDRKAFENLCDTVFPTIIKNKSPINPLRIWVAGCSTGKEAYSIAMCLDDYLKDKISAVKIQIFATDISSKSIERARAGLYHKRDMEGVSDLQLQQFFTRTEDSYQVKKTIRDMCVFACHNFLKDPPFAKIDLISCRNVLIYMNPFLQKKALTIFHYSLNEKGYLLLGKSETAGSASELFLPFGKNEKLYTRRSFPGKYMHTTHGHQEETLRDKDYALRSNEKKRDDLQKNADDILMAQYTPAGVIVNDQFDILHFRGSTGEFLEPSPGKASLNVLKMARNGLSFELRSALQKSKMSNEPFSKEGIPINNGKRLITIDVIPLLNSGELHFLILFKDSAPPKITKTASGRNSNGSPRLKNSPQNIRIRELENNLSQAREDMQSITEQQELVNSELQSANEELLSGSEELQSLNEELETSKEELQSTNEELITVNQELFDRNEQHNQARLYAEAIVATIHEPLLVLNQDFCIKSANESFFKTFRITQEDTIGKILFELQNKGWDIPELRTHLLKVQTEKRFLQWEITYAFPLAGTRTICFKAQPVQKENGQNRILLAFDDITIRKDKEIIEKKNSDELIKLLENIPQITLTASPDGSITYFNKFFLDYSGMTFEEALQKGWEPLIKPEMLDEFKKSWSDVLKTGEDFKMELQLKMKKDNSYRWHLFGASPIRNDEGVVISWVGAATDVHDQKTREEVKDEFISIASHELKTPLTTAKAYVQLLQMSMAETNNKDLLIYAQKAGASINRLNDLIGELLDVSKIQNGKLAFHITTFDFNEMITAAVEGVQYASQTHTIVRSGTINEPVTGDKDRLQQVVENLLGNAVKYSPDADKVIITIAREKNEVKVSVKDRGIGIRRENLWKIFERYYREEGRAIHFQGLGIGLYISYEIIQRHNGKLWAEINGGRGTTFYFTVPI